MKEITMDMLWPYINTIVILLIGFIVSKLLKKYQKKLYQKLKIEPVAYNFIEHLINIILWVIVILTAMSALGIKTDSFITLLATVGAAIALSIQDSLSNLFGGFTVMLSNLYDQGDYVSIGDLEGTIESTDLLHTTILTPDKKIVTIPNATINKSIIYNYSKSDIRRVEFLIGISYNSDSEYARYVLTELAKKEKRILQDPIPQCHITEYKDSSVVLSLKVWVNNADYWDINHYLKDNAILALEEAKIKIPFTQLDVHLVDQKKQNKLNMNKKRI